MSEVMFNSSLSPCQPAPFFNLLLSFGVLSILAGGTCL